MKGETIYIYAETDGMKGIIKIYHEYDWKFDAIKGDSDIIDDMEYVDHRYDTDDVMEYVYDYFDIVKEIEESDIEDYL